MASGYFDIKNSGAGMTLRTYYEESNGVVTITKVQLQSTTMAGGTDYCWYPKGTIKVGSQTVLTMDYTKPATHSFVVSTVGDNWVSMNASSSGGKLPVTANAILDKISVTISVSITLWRDKDSTMPALNGSKTIELSTGLVYIDSGSELEPYMVYIDNGSSWDRYIPYVDNGSGWDRCN